MRPLREKEGGFLLGGRAGQESLSRFHDAEQKRGGDRRGQAARASASQQAGCKGVGGLEGLEVCSCVGKKPSLR